MAKEAYQKAFLWLVNSINKATCANMDADRSVGIIGLLDIFGFEAFKTNRFEQLCINYANEKLQQKFTEDIFRNVQTEYEAEGLDLADIWYDDNTDVLDLIEGSTGLLALLNEECVRPQGNDQSFVQKALQINKSSPCLIVHRTDQLSFGIQHYAGTVMYDADMFVGKNLDTLPTDLQKCAEQCLNPIINQPRSEPSARVSSSSPRGRQSRGESNLVAPTVWTKYKNQLHSLMADLKKTRSRYIRCIKPNSVKKPELLEHGLVVDQLRSAGVVAGITISRSVFPNRLDNAVVLARYSGIWDHKNFPSKKTRDMDPLQQRVEDCKALMEGALKAKEQLVDGRVVKAFCVGRTRTYFRGGVLEWLESNRMRGLDAQAITIQKYARGWLVRNKGNNDNQRHKFADAEKERKLQEELAYFERLKKESEDRQTESRREQEQLKAKLSKLRKDIDRSTADGKRELDDLAEQKKELQRECEELQQQTNDDARKAALDQPKMILAQQTKKIEEMVKLIKLLKKENEKCRQAQDKIKERIDRFTVNQEKLSESCSNMGEQFDAQEHETIRVSDKNENLHDRLANEKAFNKDMKMKVQAMQDQYMEQAQARLNLQKTMARVLRLIQDDAKNPDIVEDTVVIALECESDCKAEMASLEAQTSFSYGLCHTDVSDESCSDNSLGL